MAQGRAEGTQSSSGSRRAAGNASCFGSVCGEPAEDSSKTHRMAARRGGPEGRAQV